MSALSLRLSLFVLCLLLLCQARYPARAQVLLDNAPRARQITIDEPSVHAVNVVSPSLVVIEAAVGDVIIAQGLGIIVREDGLILTSHQIIKGAARVQVKLKDGETYERAELIGLDERRGVAALRVPVKGLRAIKVRVVTDENIGERALALINPPDLNRTISDGLVWVFSDSLLSGVRLADDVPGAGNGFKLLQFKGAFQRSASGGIIVDEKGQGIGLIIGGYGGPDVIFAIPLSSVTGLIEQQQRQDFDVSLAGRKTEAKSPLEPTARPRQEQNVYIKTTTSLCKPVILHNELLKFALQLDKLQLKLVNEERLADIIIRIDYMPMTFFYTFTILDHREGRILGAGRVTAWDCYIAAPKLAKGIVNRLDAIHQQLKLKPDDQAKPK